MFKPVFVHTKKQQTLIKNTFIQPIKTTDLYNQLTQRLNMLNIKLVLQQSKNQKIPIKNVRWLFIFYI